MDMTHPGKSFMKYVIPSVLGMVGIPYFRIAITFTPAFMINYIVNAFTRSDGAPNLSVCSYTPVSLVWLPLSGSLQWR